MYIPPDKLTYPKKKKSKKTLKSERNIEKLFLKLSEDCWRYICYIKIKEQKRE